MTSSTTYTSTTTTTTTYVSPSPPGTPVTSNSGTNVIITWTAPTVGAPILNYTIMIATFNGQWATTSFCNGASTTTIANLNCTIPQSVLITAPFSLTQSTSVIAVVYATNSYGTSSSLNFG